MSEIYTLIEGPVLVFDTNMLHPSALPGACEARDVVFMSECGDCGREYHHCDMCFSDLPCCEEGGCNPDNCPSSWSKGVKGASCGTERIGCELCP